MGVEELEGTKKANLIGLSRVVSKNDSIVYDSFENYWIIDTQIMDEKKYTIKNPSIKTEWIGIPNDSERWSGY